MTTLENEILDYIDARKQGNILIDIVPNYFKLHGKEIQNPEISLIFIDILKKFTENILSQEKHLKNIE